METFKKNLEALERRNAELTKKIKRAPALHKPLLLKAKNGSPTLMAETPDGKKIHIHSTVNPAEEAKILVKDIDIGPLDAIFIYGAGLGYHLKELEKRITPQNAVFVFEHDLSRLRAALESLDLKSFISRPRTYILLTNDEDAIVRLFHTDPEGMFQGKVRLIVHPPSQRTAPDFYTASRRAVQNAVAGISVTLRTAYGLARKNIDNMLENMDLYGASPGISLFKDRFRGFPGVVVSAGPSLAKNIELLKKVKGRGVIMAVATTFHALLKRGIVPDFAVVIDYHAASKTYFEAVPAEFNVPLIADPKANPEAIAAYKGPKIFTDNEFLRVLLDGAVKDKGEVDMGATVAHAAAMLLDYFGCDPLILVGQDFAYSDGLSHLPGTAIFDRWRGEVNRFNTYEMQEMESIYRLGEHLVVEKDIHGNRVYVHDNLLSYRQDFERIFAEISSRVVNATEGGLPIKNTEAVSLAEAVERFCENEIPAQTYAGREDFASARDDLKSVIESLKKTSGQSRELGRLYEKAVGILKRIQNRLRNDKDVSRLIDEVTGLKNKFKKYDRVYYFIKHLVRSDERERIREDRELEVLDLEETELQKRRAKRDYEYLQALHRAERFFRRRLDRAVDALEGRVAR